MCIYTCIIALIYIHNMYPGIRAEFSSMCVYIHVLYVCIIIVACVLL